MTPIILTAALALADPPPRFFVPAEPPRPAAVCHCGPACPSAACPARLGAGPCNCTGPQPMPGLGPAWVAPLVIPLGTPAGIDLTGYTQDDLRRLFAPMNRSGTFEPLVFATRQNALDHDRPRPAVTFAPVSTQQTVQLSVVNPPSPAVSAAIAGVFYDPKSRCYRDQNGNWVCPKTVTTNRR